MPVSEYFAVLLFSAAIPVVCSLYPPLRFYRHPKALLYTIGCIVVLFGAWDCFATYRGHWTFAPRGICGLYLANLPIEEVLFFAVIPYCCIFTWEVVLFISKRMS